MAMILVVPMNLKYNDFQSYACIVASLLLAAGICFLTCQYKFTLNCNTRCDFYQYKVTVVIQFLTVWFSRCSAYNLLMRVYNLKDWIHFGIMCPLCFPFTLVDIVVLLDATQAAMKRLPRQLPTQEGSNEQKS